MCVRGPMVMPGYWRRPEATAETITADRWLRTGDIGRMEGGRLYLSSRKRDLIFRGGENVYPVEIEKRIEDHPDVEEMRGHRRRPPRARPDGEGGASFRGPATPSTSKRSRAWCAAELSLLQGARALGDPQRLVAAQRGGQDHEGRACATPRADTGFVEE